MKIKIIQIIDFPRVYEKIKKYTLPIKIAYCFSKLNAEIEKNLDFYQESTLKIVEKYGDRDESNSLIPGDGGRGVKIKQDKIEDCQKEINELLSFEVDINCEAISLEALEAIENFSLTVEDMQILMPFICV